MTSTTFVSPEISCEHCKHAIEGAVSKLAGVQSVQVDIPAKKVHVDYNEEQVSLAKIEDAVDDLGYTVVK